ncbi:MAG: hypothetical protein AAGE99_00260 [Chlamydiota bacterium]
MDGTKGLDGDFQIDFSGETSIDARLFGRFLSHFDKFVTESARLIEDCPPPIGLEVRGQKEGSFKTILSVVVVSACSLLLNNDRIQNISHLTTTIVNVILIKQHLKGKEAKGTETNGETTAVENHSGQTLKVPKEAGDIFFNDCRIDSLIINLSKDMKELEREKVSIETQGDKKVVIAKKEYESMTKSVVKSPPEETTEFEADLLIKQVDFEKSEWEFRLDDKTIKAEIKDEEFLAEVRRGQIRTLYAGVKIRSRMRRKDRSDKKTGKTEKEYTVEKVMVIIKPEQLDWLNDSPPYPRG